MCSLLEINLKFATVKHPQIIGAIERNHATVKRIMSIYEDSLAKDWHKYVDIAPFVFNTSYHSSLGCTPSLLFHGRDPFKPIDYRYSNVALKT